MPDPRLSPAIVNALRGAMQAAEVERARPAAGAAAPPRLSAAEIEPQSAARRIRESTRQRRTSYAVSPATLARELGDIASMYGLPGIESIADIAASTVEAAPSYDPVALGSSFNPLTDEAIAAAESLTGDVPYRVRQAELEQRFAEAQSRSPGSAALGTVAQGVATLPAMAALTPARGAAVGAGLGGAGGFLGSEGGDASDRVASTLRGAAQGGALGLGAGYLTRAGQAVRAPGGILRGLAGAGLEGAGTGAATSALASGERATDLGLARDAATGGAIGGALAAPFGALGGFASRLGRSRAVPGLAEDVVTPIDETLLETSAETVPDIITADTESPQLMRSLFGGASRAEADIQRLRAAGLMDRAVLNRAARAFGGGEAGIRRAAEVARRTGISPAGEISTLEMAGTRARQVRDQEAARLAQLHREVAESGATMRGEELASPLEAEIARLRRLPIDDPSIQGRIETAQALADDLRYGPRGTPARDVYEQLRAAPDITDEAVLRPAAPPPVPGTEVYGPAELEAVGVPLREALPEPQRLPYQQGRDLIRELADSLRMYERATDPAYASRQSILTEAHRSLTNERNAAARAALGERFASEMMPANEAFRLAATIAPEGTIPNYLQRNEGLLRSALARSGGDNGILNRYLIGQLERAYTRAEPSINARLAETMTAPLPESVASAARGAGEALSGVGRLGGVASTGLDPSQRVTAAIASANAAVPSAVISADPSAMQALDDELFGTGEPMDEEEAARLRALDEELFGGPSQ